jgi:replicative DNA helicase
MSLGRTPPNAPDDERRLLSCVFVDGSESFSKAVNAGVTAETFYEARNRVLWLAMSSIAASGGMITPDIVASTIQARDQLAAIGGWDHLMNVSRAEATTAHAETFIRRLRNLEVLRGVIHEGTMMVEACYALKDEDPASVLDPALSRLLTVSAGMGIAQDKSWNDVVAQSAVMLEEIIRDGGVPEHMAIHWPWRRMDYLFAPMQRGQLVLLGARPSIGKSSLARPIALTAALQGKGVYFVTLEVNPERVPLQIASMLSKIGLREANRAHPKDQDDLRNALKALKGLGITISRRDTSLARIAGRARALKAQGKLDLLVIDHGLLLDDVVPGSSKGKDDSTASITRVTASLKKLAGELNCVVLLLWQLNRGSERDDNREPGMIDLRGCGSLEQDADKILFIHRPSENPLTALPQTSSMTVEQCPSYFQNVIQAKGRDDGTSLMSFMFHRQTARFTEITDPAKA